MIGGVHVVIKHIVMSHCLTKCCTLGFYFWVWVNYVLRLSGTKQGAIQSSWVVSSHALNSGRGGHLYFGIKFREFVYFQFPSQLIDLNSGRKFDFYQLWTSRHF